MPLRNHEDIVVFYKKLPTYNPQKTVGAKNHSRGYMKNEQKNQCYGKFDASLSENDFSGMKYPTSIIDVEKEHCKTFHPTQKPVELISYLIKTYTNEGDLVLDNCMGSGTTAIACIKENRNFIGFETNEEYFEKANKRINDEKSIVKLF